MISQPGEESQRSNINYLSNLEYECPAFPVATAILTVVRFFLQLQKQIRRKGINFHFTSENQCPLMNPGDKVGFTPFRSRTSNL